MNGESETAGALERLGMVEDVRHLLTSVTYGDTDPKLLDDVAAVVRQAIAERRALMDLVENTAVGGGYLSAMRTAQALLEYTADVNLSAMMFGKLNAGDLVRMVRDVFTTVDWLTVECGKLDYCLSAAAQRLQDAAPAGDGKPIERMDVPAAVDELIQQRNALSLEVSRLNRLVDRHAAEINRRRGEMAVAREALADCGVPSDDNGVTLTMSQRIKSLGRK